MANFGTSADDANPGHVAWLERIWVIFTLILFVFTGAHLIHHDAFIGQDYRFHYECATKAATDPSRWFYMDYTSRPILYWTAAWLQKFTVPANAIPASASLWLAAGALSLGLFHDALRFSIHSAWVRVAALNMVAFLPLTLLTTVVFAADTTATLPYCLSLWALVRWHAARGSRHRGLWLLLACAALCLGQFSKFTFVVLPIASALTLLAAWRWSLVTRPEALTALAAITVVPLLTAGYLHQRCLRELEGVPRRHFYNWSGTREMTWDKLTTVTKKDLRTLDAPVYWDPLTEGDKVFLPLATSNYYSFPALANLGIFTDVLGLSHRNGPKAQTTRPPFRQNLAEWSVRLGAGWSVLLVCSTVWFIVRVVSQGFRAKSPFPLSVGLWGAAGLAWFTPLFITLPFVHRAYEWGYWLPRLYLPAIVSGFLVLFSLLDGIVSREWIRVTLFSITLVQGGVHLGALWAG